VPDATPFQSPDWLIPWWRHIGEGDLLTLAAREDDALVGLLPLYVYARPEGGRVLFPLGIATTDYLDALILPGRERAVMDLAFRHLAAPPRGCWEEAEWPQLRPGSPLLGAPAPPGWADRTEPAEPCPVLHLPRRLEELGETVSRKTLRDLRTHRRRAEAAGPLRWEAAEPGNLEALFAALLRLHAARWATREGGAGVLASPAVQAAHRAALPGLLRTGLLRLHALRLGGDVVAVLYALADPPERPARRLYFYISGFDPGLERLSPGMLLVGHAIEEAIAEGFAVADFLRGQERYKYFWGAQDTPLFRRRLRPLPLPPPEGAS
jgi:CelD/BcsL family acetyltransferase involved in cellulose biosynthesis